MVKTWNERLKELRESRTLTQQQLAGKAKLSQGMISGLEKGKKKFTQETLDKILAVLGCKYHDIFAERTKEELEVELKILQTKVRILESKSDDPPEKAESL
jgi:transcriptional regulator with XRE-family HTH domain